MFLCARGKQFATPLLLSHGTDDEINPADDGTPDPASPSSTTTATATVKNAALVALAQTASRSQDATNNAARRRRQLRRIQRHAWDLSQRVRHLASASHEVTRALGGGGDGDEVEAQREHPATATPAVERERAREKMKSAVVMCGMGAAGVVAVLLLAAGWVLWLRAFEVPPAWREVKMLPQSAS